MENLLDQAITNVREFLPSWPKNATDWYHYLYAGDVPRDLGVNWPPRTYASEIKTFYENAENIRKKISQEDPESAAAQNKSFRFWMSFAALVGGAGTVWIGCVPLHLSFRRRYSQRLSEEHLNEKMEQLRAAFGYE